jgi:hypothetical protein
LSGTGNDATIGIGDLPEADVLLEPERIKGGGLDPARRLTIGGPLTIPLDEGTADPNDHELRAFMTQEAGTYAYWQVLLSCTFRRDDDEPFASASVNLTLAREDGKPEPAPVAWSMRPLSLLQLRPIPWSVKLGTSVHFLTAEAEWHPGDKTEPAVLALGELEPTPGWDFSKTAASPLLGSQRLTLIVRAPVGVATAGELSVDAGIIRRRSGVVPHASLFPTGRTLPFRIPPSA